jgi:hypothetical protein
LFIRSTDQAVSFNAISAHQEFAWNSVNAPDGVREIKLPPFLGGELAGQPGAGDVEQFLLAMRDPGHANRFISGPAHDLIAIWRKVSSPYRPFMPT